MLAHVAVQACRGTGSLFCVQRFEIIPLLCLFFFFNSAVDRVAAGLCGGVEDVLARVRAAGLSWYMLLLFSRFRPAGFGRPARFHGG